jgi:hypothetical protein
VNIAVISPELEAERRRLLRDPNWDEPEVDEGPWRSRKVHLGGRDRFWTDSGGDGIFCTLLPIYDPVSFEVFDVIAWEPSRPGRWWWQSGLATHLGEDDLLAIQLAPRRGIRLVENPQAWLDAKSPVVCILDWNADLRALLRDVSTIHCSTLRLAEFLERRLAEQVAHRFDIRAARRR